MSALLIRRRRPIGEPLDDRSTGPHAPGGPGRPYDTIDGTAGAGRVCAALLELGVDLSGLRQAVLDSGATIGDLETIDLGGRFDRVVLGSHFVNVPDEPLRAALLRLAGRHAAQDGTVLVEHHPLDWAETAEPTSATPGADVGMEDVRREPPFVSAVSTYDVGGRTIRQPFTARVLTEDELAAALAAAGLRVRRRLAPTWLEAHRPTIAR